MAVGLKAMVAAVWVMMAFSAVAAPVGVGAESGQQKTLEQRAQVLIDRGLAYLATQQKADGGWINPPEPPAISALVLRAMAKERVHQGVPALGSDAADPVKRGFDHLLTFQLSDGGIYRDLLANYNTAIAISAMAATQDKRFDASIASALAYLKQLQWTQATPAGPKGETVDGVNHPWYGGWGYGRSGRPDGSNFNIAVDALKDAGLDPKDPAFQAAVVFASRMQNLSETNDQPWAGNDGGFAYTPANNGESFAGEYQDDAGQRRLRSYGSMTYAGLKSMIYAGLSKDDPRVKAAFDWISASFTVDENPGMRAGNPDNARHGLYYYYLTMARALHAYGSANIATNDGGVDWREALVSKLETLVQADGSFVGEARWMEASPVLVTSYVVLALQEVRQDLQATGK